jgi:hypothetical protein
MPRSRRALPLILCFGLGLGLAPTLRPADARSCGTASWQLERLSLEGEGERELEEAYWEATMWLTDEGGDQAAASFDMHRGVSLRRLP